MSDARGRRERLYHPEGGHTSTELDIITVPAARALAIARLEAEAEDARWEAERAEAETRWWRSMIAAAEAENRRRKAAERAIARRIAKAELEQQTEPRLCPPPPKLRDIARVVAEHYGVTVLDLASDRRTARVLLPRQVFCYLARKITTRSFPQIGDHLGNRDHTTILHAFNRIAIRIATDAQLAADVAAIRKTLEGGMTIPHCPACGQPLIEHGVLDLTPTQRRIIELLRRRKGMSGEDLRNAIWTHANGGPDSASLLHAHIWHLNKRLRAHGLVVRASRWSGYCIKTLEGA